MKKIIVIIALLSLISCSDNKKYIEWQLLFKFEGCSYYEFIVNNKPYYMVDCSHKIYKVEPIEEVF